MPQTHLDLVRIGIAMYGLWPSEEIKKDAWDLKPAFSLHSHIVYLKTLDAGREISYGGTYKTDDNVILEIDLYGNKKIRFEPVPANETKKAMEQLFLAFMEANSNLQKSQTVLRIAHLSISQTLKLSRDILINNYKNIVNIRRDSKKIIEYCNSNN